MGYIREIRNKQSVEIVSAVCDECAAIVEVEDCGIVSGMAIGLEGGYRAFFDHSALTIVLCEKCSTRLCEQFISIHREVFHGDMPGDVEGIANCERCSKVP